MPVVFDSSLKVFFNYNNCKINHFRCLSAFVAVWVLALATLLTIGGFGLGAQISVLVPSLKTAMLNGLYGRRSTA